MNDRADDVGVRFRALLGRRHFVDRESGVLLVWLPTDRGELVELVRLVEARHPAARFSVQESGSGLAVRMSAREQDLAEIEALYMGAADTADATAEPGAAAQDPGPAAART